MLMPKKTKYRKMMKGRMKGTETRGTEFEFGRYALRAVEPGWITSRQIEAARRAMTREIKRGGNVWIKIFPDKPITAKPAETRMGSGKGSPEYWVAVVKPGRVIFEVKAANKDLMIKALKLAQYKLPIKTKIVSKEDLEAKFDVTPEVKEAK